MGGPAPCSTPRCARHSELAWSICTAYRDRSTTRASFTRALASVASLWVVVARMSRQRRASAQTPAALRRRPFRSRANGDPAMASRLAAVGPSALHPSLVAAAAAGPQLDQGAVRGARACHFQAQPRLDPGDG